MTDHALILAGLIVGCIGLGVTGVGVVLPAETRLPNSV